MKIVRSLIYLLLSISFFSAQAKLSTDVDNSNASFKQQVSELGSMSYMAILPSLRTTAGQSGQDKVATLNDAYRDLKAQGVEQPTLDQVLKRKAQVGSGGQSASVVYDLTNFLCDTITLAGISGGAIGGASYVLSRYEKAMKTPDAAKPVAPSECKNKVSLLYQNSTVKAQSQTAQLKVSSVPTVQ